MKQRYILDWDDILTEDLFTKDNSNNLILGVSATGTEQLSVGVGGLGNDKFTAGQTLIFDGNKVVSSGSLPIAPAAGPLMNDDRYYTKTQIDAFFASMASSGGFPVAYANITGAPVVGAKLQFVTPVTIASVSSVMGSPVVFNMTPPTGYTIVAALITVTCNLNGPNTSSPAKFYVQQNLTSPQIDVGWFWAAGGGDAVAGCNGTLVPVDPVAQSFYYQLTGNSVAGGTPIVAKLIGYFYQ